MSQCLGPLVEVPAHSTQWASLLQPHSRDVWCFLAVASPWTMVIDVRVGERRTGGNGGSWARGRVAFASICSWAVD